MKVKSFSQEFSSNLAKIRRAKGFSQQKLADAIGVSRRVITYYENGETSHPPAHLLVPIAKALKVSVDELLGLKKSQISDSNHAALWRRLKKAEQLPKRQQKAVIDYIEALLIKTHKI